MYFKGVNRGLKVTALGWQLVILTLAVGLFGISTGINGMFVFLGISLGLFVVSGVVSEKNIDKSQINLLTKDQFFDQGRKGVIHFNLENNNRDISIYSLGASFYLKDPSTSSDQRKNPVVSEKHINLLAAKNKKSCESYLSKLQRGFFNQIYIMQHTTFPFGIFLKYKISKTPASIYVLPEKRSELIPLWLEIVQSIRVKNIGNEEFDVHEPFLLSTPFNKIDWKKNSGRDIDQWVAKKFSTESQNQSICIKPTIKDFKGLSDDDFELLLGNIRTGLDILHASNFNVNLDLESYGVSLGFDATRKKISQMNKISEHDFESTPAPGYIVYVSTDEVKF